MGSHRNLSIAIKAGIHKEGASNNPAVTCCVNILGKDKGIQVSSSAGKSYPLVGTIVHHTTHKDTVVKLPAS